MRVMHLLDDGAMGGVVRMLAALMPRLRYVAAQGRAIVATDMPAPALQADVIVLHLTLAWRKLPWVTALRRRNPGARLVLIEHSYSAAFEAQYVPDRLRFRAMLRLGYAMVDHVVAVSPSQAAWIRRATGIAAAKLSVIGPVTDLAKLRALPGVRRGKGKLRLCGYGRYAPQKGFDTLVRAMQAVPQDAATLRLVGAGPDEAALRALAAGLPHVRIEGPADGPETLFGEIDALAVPSRYEPGGCVGFEARAAGLPMIVSDADSLADHFVAAPQLRVPAQDEAALAGAIIWLAAQDLTPLGAAARQSVAEAESMTAEAWIALLERLRPATRRRERFGWAA